MATIHRLQLNEVEAISRYRDIIEEELSQEVIDYGTEPGLRALHVVARAGEVELARNLIRKRADVNFCTTKGLSPLHYAVLSGKPSMIRLLLLYGARINVRAQRDGKTPLFSAAEKGFIEIVKLLLENGANSQIPDQHDITPAEIAACYGYDEVSNLLRSREEDSQEISPNPVFALMNPRRPSRQQQQSMQQATSSPTSPLSSLTLSPSTLMNSINHAAPSAPSLFENANTDLSDAPPSYEEVMSSDSLFGCTAYSQSTEDSDTTALLSAE